MTIFFQEESSLISPFQIRHFRFLGRHQWAVADDRDVLNAEYDGSFTE